LLASIELAGVHHKRVNIKSAIIIAGTMTSCSTAILAAKSILADLALIASRFSQAFMQENFTSKWWIRSRVEAMNFTKYKLFKTQRKQTSEKSARKLQVLWMML